MTTKLAYCPICNNHKENKTQPYCTIHNLAKKALKDGYKQWLTAYGTMSWDEYVKKLLELDDIVGISVREVAEHERYFKPT